MSDNDKNVSISENNKTSEIESTDEDVNVVLSNQIDIQINLSNQEWEELNNYSRQVVDELKKGYWYTINCVGGKERKIVENLKKSLIYNNHDEVQQILVCYKEKESISAKSKKKIRRTVNDMPGAIFIKTFMTKEIHSLIRRLENVISFIGEQRGSALQPEVIPAKEIDRLILKYLSDTYVEELKHIEVDFKVGDFVEIINGVLEGYVGEVTAIEKDSIKIAIEMLGRKVSSDVPIVNVKPVG